MLETLHTCCDVLAVPLNRCRELKRASSTGAVLSAAACTPTTANGDRGGLTPSWLSLVGSCAVAPCCVSIHACDEAGYEQST